MNKDELYIGMLCYCPDGTGVVSWVDEYARYVYVSDISGEHFYRLSVNELDIPAHICM